MSNSLRICAIAAISALFAGLGMSGCGSTPDLTKATALALIQANYDQQPAKGVTIEVDQMGLKQGLAANYWKLTKIYPNNRWADYTLTDVGKKALTLDAGGDVIQWRPETGNESHFFVTTVAANHLKAKEVQDAQDEVVPGVSTAKSTVFTESVVLTNVPQPLQDMLHNPGNKPSSKRHADFALNGDAWSVHSIQ